MTVRFIAGIVFALAVMAGTLTDRPSKAGPVGTTVLAGDFHVHAAPGDGVLPVWEIQSEAARRGLDVVAITNHNQNAATRMARALGFVDPYPIVIPSQELTTSGFHMAAIGVSEMIDWRLPASAAIAAIHAQGGVAIAAHPIQKSWVDVSAAALRMLDGSEVSHPMIRGHAPLGAELLAFFQHTRTVNPDLAPIGSSDFHGATPLGLCRTYLIVDEVSRAGVLDAIRRGRTVASGPGDRLVGDDAHVEAVRAHLRRPQAPGFGYTVSTWLALGAILALGVIVVLD
ncbi:MAG TPA: CehA/McbA family metallohydrolase [Vicinamibacterales bacterium]|nr:CehA/McbA family metallohydrolase [Vicinamibacterales bacterium]